VLPLSAGRGVSASQLPDPGGAAAPFAFFSACLLGRVRHLPGGRQRGWALRLLEHGAPAVVGALAAIPDQDCVPVAEAFYGAAYREPVGEAMRLARARLDATGVHPLVWAAYALHGDPHARIGAGGGSAALVRRWPAHATRHLVTGDPDDLAAVHAARPELAAEPDLAGLAAQLLDSDPEGAAVCRLLLALARGERELAHLLASALNDGYAVLRTLDGAWEGREAARDAAVRWWRAALAGDPAL
jgi:hypothetical protein